VLLLFYFSCPACGLATLRVNGSGQLYKMYKLMQFILCKMRVHFFSPKRQSLLGSSFSMYEKFSFCWHRALTHWQIKVQICIQRSADATEVRYIFWSSLQTRLKFRKFALYNIEVRREVQIQGRRSSHPQKFAIILLHAWNFYTAIGSSLTDIRKFTSIFEHLMHSVFLDGNHTHRNRPYNHRLHKSTNSTYN
jgi:hypothetical protein